MKIYDRIINVLNEGVTNDRFKSVLSDLLDINPDDISVKRYSEDGAWIIIKGYKRKVQAVGSNLFIGLFQFNMDSKKQLADFKDELNKYKGNIEQLSFDLDNETTEAEMVSREAGKIDPERRAKLVARLKKYWPRVPKAWIDSRTDDYIEQVVTSYENRSKKLTPEELEKKKNELKRNEFKEKLKKALGK